jgi:acetyltransferase-like isoleucine patch superfamily enzyme
MSLRAPSTGRRIRVVLRMSWVVLTLCVCQALVFGLAVAPVVFLWFVFGPSTESHPALRVILSSLAIVPSYVLFALTLMPLSALATRLLGWRTLPNLEMRMVDMEWPLLNWVRFMVSIHIVRVFAGSLFRGSPIWTMYLRLAGARLGRRVYVNSLALSDYNLLNFGDGVVIGEDVHLSGHTVEGGIVKTGTVRLGDNVTIGVGSIVDIDVEVGSNCQVGALSLVPKHSKLEGPAIYAGIPVRRLDKEEARQGRG